MEPLIRVDLDKLIHGSTPVIVELGCGKSKREGRIGIDLQDLPHVDIVADLECGLSFLPDNSVDEIYSRSLLEHIDNFENLMREIVRVLKKGGKNYLFVPHFSNPYYYSDYTHKKYFGLYTFYYFVDDKYHLSRKVPDFYTDIRIRIVSQKLIFCSPFKVRNLLKRFLGHIFNLNSPMQEFYEENLCYIFPCYGIEVVFTPDK
jgi:SAM-dependent methyltransferase